MSDGTKVSKHHLSVLVIFALTISFIRYSALMIRALYSRSSRRDSSPDVLVTLCFGSNLKVPQLLKHTSSVQDSLQGRYKWQGKGGGERGILWWASIPSQGSGNTPRHLILRKHRQALSGWIGTVCLNIALPFTNCAIVPFYPLVCPDKINTLSSWGVIRMRTKTLINREIQLSWCKTKFLVLHWKKSMAVRKEKWYLT